MTTAAMIDLLSKNVRFPFHFLTLTCCFLTSCVEPNPTCLVNCKCAQSTAIPYTQLTNNLIVDCSSANYSDLPSKERQNHASSLSKGHQKAIVASTTVLLLIHNNMTRLELTDLESWPELRRLDLSRNRVKSVVGFLGETNHDLPLEHLSLSFNHIQVLHPYVFSYLPSLTQLNLSHNNIHTIYGQTFHLARLHSLDLSHNELPELQPGLFTSFLNLRMLFLGHNRMSRLLDGIFNGIDNLQLLDLSYNFIMDIEMNTLTGLNVTYLNLAHNSLRKIPTMALSRLHYITTLVLDGLMSSTLEFGALQDIPLKFLSISSCPHLTFLERGSLYNLKSMETLTLNNNPGLAYFHPGSVSGDNSNLVALDLTNNNLSALEDVQPYVPSLRTLYLSGNQFRCHCGLAWLKDSLGSPTANIKNGLSVEDAQSVVCLSKRSPKQPASSQDYPFSSRLLFSVLRPGIDCSPYILPLFPLSLEVEMGHNASVICKIVGTADEKLKWRLPDGRSITDGNCVDRACVHKGGILQLSYIHPKDTGPYTCIAENTHGTEQRAVNVTVKLLHIQIFPLTIADTFVTLSWNTSRSLARDFVLHVIAETSLSSVRFSDSSSEVPTLLDSNSSTPHLEYSNIEVGLKMSSYTVSGLLPSTAYKILLCMKKGDHLMYVSSTSVVTKPENYMHQLGIKKDYTLLIGVSLILMVFTLVCFGVSIARLYRLRRLITRGARPAGILGSVGDPCSDDNLSTKQIMSSSSEPSSLAAGIVTASAATSARQNGKRRGSASSTIVNHCYIPSDKEKSRLMENEVATPTDDSLMQIAAEYEKDKPKKSST